MNWMLVFVRLMLGAISPELHQAILTTLNQWEEQANQTPNPWDNVFVGFIKNLYENRK